MTTLTTASVLAFERKLEISDAIFTQIDSQKADAKITNVIIRKKGVRGTISNRLKTSNNASGATPPRKTICI